MTERIKEKDLDKWYNRNPQLELVLEQTGRDWFKLTYEEKLKMYGVKE